MYGNIFNEYVQSIKASYSWPISKKLVLAVSGGPDSVFLTLLMKEVAKLIGFNLHIVHVDHCLRGEESLKDSTFVRKFAEKLKISCRIVRIDIPRIMEQESGSSQEICRKYRIAYLREEAKRVDAFGIAFGHNKDDQAETVLINLIRGAGLDGLSGMKEFDRIDNIFIYRPILNIKRSEIENYLALVKQNFRTDKSNLSDDYLRNHIRHNLIPYIEKEYNPNIIQVLYNTSIIINNDNEFLKTYTEKIYREVFTKQEGLLKAKANEISKLSQAVQLRVLRLAYERLVGKLDSITFDHSNMMIDVVKSAHGFSVSLPNSILLSRVYEEIWMYKAGYFAVDNISSALVKLDEVIEHGDTKLIIRKSYDKEYNYIKEYIFDEKKLKFPLRLRTKKDGDRFSPFGLDGSKKVKDFFIDEKIPQQIRNSIPLLVDGDDNILAIIGLRRSSKALVDSNTKDIIKCEILEVPNWKRI